MDSGEFWAREVALPDGAKRNPDLISVSNRGIPVLGYTYGGVLRSTIAQDASLKLRACMPTSLCYLESQPLAKQRHPWSCRASIQVGMSCCGNNGRVLTGLGVRKSSADGLQGCPGAASRRPSEGLCSIFCARPCSARGGVPAASCIMPTQISAQYRQTRQGQQHCSMPSYRCQLLWHADTLRAVYDRRAVSQEG